MKPAKQRYDEMMEKTRALERRIGTLPDILEWQAQICLSCGHSFLRVNWCRHFPNACICMWSWWCPTHDGGCGRKNNQLVVRWPFPEFKKLWQEKHDFYVKLPEGSQLDMFPREIPGPFDEVKKWIAEGMPRFPWEVGLTSEERV